MEERIDLLAKTKAELQLALVIAKNFELLKSH